MSHVAEVCNEHENCTIVNGEHKKNFPNPLKEWTKKQVDEINDSVKFVKPILAIIDEELALEALFKNILILEDPFRTGFECKACDGEGHTKDKCTKCFGNKVVAQNPEFDAAATTLSEEELSTLPPHFQETLRKKRAEQKDSVVVSGGLVPCMACVCTDKWGGFLPSGFEKCKICMGKGSSIVVPEQAMNRPTSGKVVAVGPQCNTLRAGDRIVYSNMVGNCVKLKNKDVFRYMREDEISFRLHGTRTENFQKKIE